MGKAIGSIEKHPICAGTLNETAVRERVDKIKAAWNKSVKALKEKVSIDHSSPSSSGGLGFSLTFFVRYYSKESPQAQLPKRQIEYSQSDTSPITKKARTEEKKPSTFSSLLKKVNTDSSATRALNVDSDKSSTSAAKESPKQLAESKLKNGDNMKTGTCSLKKFEAKSEYRAHAKVFLCREKETEKEGQMAGSLWRRFDCQHYNRRRRLEGG